MNFLKKIQLQNEHYLLMLFLISFILYIPALKAPFFWDDYIMVPGLEQHSGSEHSEFRPVRAWTLFLDSIIWKKNPSGYHFTNIILNSIAGVITFLFVNLFFKNKIFSFLVSLLFVVHPVHTETVIWIKNRTELICYIFMLLTFLNYFKYKKYSYAFFIVAILSKETAAVLPLLITIYLYLYDNKQNIKYTLPLWIISFVRLVIGVQWSSELVGSGEVIGLQMHILTIVKTYVYYAFLLVFPKNLSIEYWVDVTGSLLDMPNLLYVIIFMMFLSVLYFVRKNKFYLFFVTAFFVSILPYSNIIFIAGRPWAVQRLYFPSLMFSIILGKMLLTTKKSKYLFIPIIIIFSIMTLIKSFDWQHPEKLWQSAEQFSIYKGRVLHNLGSLSYERGDYKSAQRYFSKSLEIDPVGSYMALHNLGLTYMKQGEFLEAIECLTGVLQVNPSHLESNYNLGIVYMQLNQYDRSAEFFEQAIRLEPKEVKIYNNLAVVYQRNNKPSQAIKVLQNALKIQPDYINAKYNLAMIYLKNNMYEEAEMIIKSVLKKQSNHPTFLKLLQELDVKRK